MKNNKPLIVIVIVISVVGSLGYIFHKIENNLCNNGEFIYAVSPKGIRADIYIRDCGATTDYVTNVEISEHKVFSTNHYHKNDITIRWNGNNIFVIEYLGKKDDIFLYDKTYQDINIELIQK